MAAVQLADVIIPAVYETYTSVNNVETNAFVAGGIAVTNPLLNGFEDEGGILGSNALLERFRRNR